MLYYTKRATGGARIFKKSGYRHKIVDVGTVT